jgi:hypothetical protein
MTRETTIHLEPGGPRRSLQVEQGTDDQVADLVAWGYGKNLTEVARHAIREAWERQVMYRKEKRMRLDEAVKRIQYDSSWGIWASVPFMPESGARFGQCQFENGGLLDDKVFFANGVEVGDYMLRHCDGDNDLLSDPDWIAEGADWMIAEYEEERED